MKKNRLIFYSVFGVFHLFLVVFSFYVESNRNDFGFLTQMLKWISLMKYGAILGLVLLVADVIWEYVVLRDKDREREVLHQEINTLKAKIFDLQESAKDAHQSQNS